MQALRLRIWRAHAARRALRDRGDAQDQGSVMDGMEKSLAASRPYAFGARPWGKRIQGASERYLPR
ncbi:hypothetical protein V475_22400 [Sphingobium baderi LL03]|uniref:Uncharacterized protein n=1 Tax=Sphingobium baderi LL03 TaxID=1114964 RepID=T0I501_9SPHN|nr:hypothetical protein K426_26010 [Sphingobium sp. TKS]EQB04714.1 hypothetical protein L485_03715 [Sphingobium baderi LL03]KMS51641.1 hypothetical protein V475_22400 [Sphingobium baderi LL03]